MASINTPAFADLLQQAVTLPGTLSTAYQQFHDYSLGNVLLAWSQCAGRQIPLGPLATYPRWKALGRHVKRGETALTLCQPITIRRKDADANDESEIIVRFTYPESMVCPGADRWRRSAPGRPCRAGTRRGRWPPSTSPRSRSMSSTATSWGTRAIATSASRRSIRFRSRRCFTNSRMCCSAIPPSLRRPNRDIDTAQPARGGGRGRRAAVL